MVESERYGRYVSFLLGGVLLIAAPLIAASSCETRDSAMEETRRISGGGAGNDTTTTVAGAMTDDGDEAVDTSGDAKEANKALNVEGGVASSLRDDARVVFLHHSTGQNIWDGGVEDWFHRYNSKQGKRYHVEERVYPTEEYGWKNYPFDYWNIWINNSGPRPYRGQDTLEILTKSYDVIVWKHCFPVSDVGEATTGDITSERRNLPSYRLQYAALRDKMRGFPNVRFLLWTGAARVRGETQPNLAKNAQSFFRWVKTDWDEPGDNIFLFDFYQLETEGGLYLLDRHAQGADDSHPNEAFSKRVAPLFAQRVVDVIEGRGDASGNLTGQR